ncbi:MAG: signal recognition particle protein [Phycisphaerae bacterium]|nr:signal recognition particle protein [Phycisphaerae bacterium]
MFERLSESFGNLYRRLSGKGAISESNVQEALADVRAALLEADVNADVVNDFTAAVLKDSVGQQVTKSLKPGEEMIGIVYRRLIDLLGGAPPISDDRLGELTQEAAQTIGVSLPAPAATDSGIMRVAPGPTVVMMCGLQGSGKTTTCGKIAAYLKKRGRSVMLAAVDLQRPAAVDQLETIAKQVQADQPGGAAVLFYSEPDKVAAYGKAIGAAVTVAQHALTAARKAGVDTLILDTAGRLHVNDELMNELSAIDRSVHPHQIFLVVDSMSGQDAMTSAKAFHQRLNVDGLILTKFDSDARGGAAISARSVTGAPIRFVGVGEKLDALEEFHAERMAGRILGMGDVVSLVEKAQEQVSAEEAAKLEAKLARGEMSMEDFLGQLRALRRMGPLKQLMGLIPGVGAALKGVQVDDKQLDRVEAIIHSMTKKERAKPDIIDHSRRRRIAGGSGTKPDEVSLLVKQFQTISKLSKGMAGMSAAAKVKAVRELSSGGMEGLVPGLSGMPGLGTKGSTRTSSVKDRFKKRRK